MVRGTATGTTTASIKAVVSGEYPYASPDLIRWHRHNRGESISDIAKYDEMDERAAVKSIQIGSDENRIAVQNQVVSMKLIGQKQNEKLRGEIREVVGPMIVEALKMLLGGQREVQKIGKDGEVFTTKFIDPDLISDGIEKFAQMTSLQEKPAAPTTVVNVNQQNVSNSAHISGSTMEERLDEIRKKQALAHKTIDVELLTAAPQEEEEQPGVMTADAILNSNPEEESAVATKEQDPW